MLAALQNCPIGRGNPYIEINPHEPTRNAP